MIVRTEERERVLYEFDAFRVDPVRRVLLRDGEPVAITPKALSILLVLLERPGEVVEKSDLLERIWPGVFVTEANLTQNVFSLRKSLGERANDNRYIVTIPGRGYSFAGDLQRVDRSPTAEIQIPADLLTPPTPPAPTVPTAPPLPETGEFPIVLSLPAAMAPPAPAPTTGEITAVAPAAPAVTPILAAPAPPWRRFLQWTVGALVALVLIATAAHIIRHLGPEEEKALAKAPAPAPAAPAVAAVRPSIAVLDFKSLAPNRETRWLETAFSEMLTTELAASGKLRVIRGETVAETMRSLGFHDPTGLGADDLRRLRESLGADLLVVGSYLPFQGKIRLDVRVLEIPRGDVAASFVEVGTETGLFDLVSRAGANLRESLGVPVRSPEQIQQARALRPSSTEASRLYAEGLARLRDFDPPGALVLLQQAAKADPSSAVIHSALSRNWGLLGYDQRALDEARLAVDNAKSLSREERLLAEARLHQAARQWREASETYRSLWTFYPDDIEYGLQLADALTLGGRGAEATTALAALRKLPPPSGEDARIDLAEAKNARRLSDFAAQKRAAVTAATKARRLRQSLLVSQALIYQGDALITEGRAQEAIPLFEEAVELARRAGYQWGTGMALSNLGSGLQMVGDLDGAEKATAESLAIAQRLGTRMGAAAQYQNLGKIHQDRGELDEALRLFDRAREGFVGIGDRLLELRVLNDSGAVLGLQGDFAGARQRFERSLALSQSLGNRADEALSLDNLGGLLEEQGELAAARRRHEEAFAILQKAGDRSASAWALAGAASAAGKLGDLRTGWQRATEALAMDRQAGDRIGAGRVLGVQARLAYEMGDLATSRSSARDQLQIARETGARSLTARALQHLGRVDFAAGEVEAASGKLTEALQVSSSLGEELRAMEIRLDLAHLALASGKAGEAARLAEVAHAWCQPRGIPSCDLDARATLAEALLRQGRRREAAAAAAQARPLAERAEDRGVRIRAAIRLAKIEADTGDRAQAMRQLRRAVEEASGLGLTAAGLGARLALGELQREAGDPAAAATLAAVRKEATARGYKRVAEIAGRAPAVPAVKKPAL